MKLELPVTDGPKLLKETTSRCPVCHASCPGRVVARGNEVYLERTCKTHGSRTACIASDKRFYNLSVGERSNADEDAPGCCAGATAPPSQGCGDATEPDTLERLSTCLALIEIVDSCNLACPTCFADSPLSGSVACVSLEDIQRRVNGVLTRKGEIEILQLSGGEPTLHPRFFEILRWCQQNPQIGYVLVNTNGVRIARDPQFAETFERTFERGKVQLYLQYDGPQERGQRALRGADLRAMRERALEVTRSMGGGGLPVTLAMTVTHETIGHAWETIEAGLQYAHVRGVTFQPLFGSGRTTTRPGATTETAGESRRPLNTADVILAAVAQSKGRLKFEDFTPLPCGDPNCATIGYLLKLPQGVRSLSDFVDFSRLQDFLQQRVNYDVEDLARCGCESEPLGELLHTLEVSAANTFRLFIKPFMDAWSWDEDRIDRCCTHVIRPDGRLDSFCRYYSEFPGTWNGPDGTGKNVGSPNTPSSRTYHGESS